MASNRLTSIVLPALLAITPVTLICEPALAACEEVPASGQIAKEGSFCLQGNLETSRPIAIEVLAPNVVLDLNNFEVSAAAGAEEKLNFGVKISGSPTVRNVKVRNGTIRHFKIGIASQDGSDVSLEGLKILDSGAIGLLNTSNDVVIRDTSITGVGTGALDPEQAYSIGLNLSGHNTLVEHVKISDIHRQKKSRDVVGEAVGILIHSECDQCLIKESHVENTTDDNGSIGIWNAALGTTRIVDNQINGFERAIFTAARRYEIINNRLTCGPNYKASVGTILVLRHPVGPDAFGASAGNKVESCLVESFQCFSDCDPKIVDFLKRNENIMSANPSTADRPN